MVLQPRRCAIYLFFFLVKPTIWLWVYRLSASFFVPFVSWNSPFSLSFTLLFTVRQHSDLFFFKIPFLLLELQVANMHSRWHWMLMVHLSICVASWVHIAYIWYHFLLSSLTFVHILFFVHTFLLHCSRFLLFVSFVFRYFFPSKSIESQRKNHSPRSFLFILHPIVQRTYATEKKLLTEP